MWGETQVLLQHKGISDVGLEGPRCGHPQRPHHRALEDDEASKDSCPWEVCTLLLELQQKERPLVQQGAQERGC